jgi:hypothetical protein
MRPFDGVSQMLAQRHRVIRICWTVREAMAIPAQHYGLELGYSSIEFGVLGMHPKALTDWVSVRIAGELCFRDVV